MATIWTPEEIAIAQDMRASGESNATIAIKLGRTVASVRKKLIAIAAPPPRRAVSWPPADDEFIRNMRAKGIPYNAIADRMGRSVKAVESRALRIGVPPFVRPDRRVPAIRPARGRGRIPEAALSPFGYDASARAWALSNPLNPEARLILVHLVESGEMKTDDVRAVLPRHPRKTTEHRSA